MSNNIMVLLVHGMGTHDDNSIKKEFISGLEQSLKFYGKDPINFEQKIDFDFFNYSEEWDELRKDFADDFSNHDFDMEALLKLTPGMVQTLVNLLKDFGSDKFLHTHVLDVLFYLTGQLRSQQLANYYVKLATKIKDMHSTLDGRKLVVVAHSLGTAFTHDALNAMYSPNNPHGIDNVLHQIHQVWMVANVSRLTHMVTGLADPRDSYVCDISEQNPYGMCKHFYSVFNEFDPFCWFKRFERRPEFAIEDGGILRTTHVRDLKKVYQDDNESKVNPHDLREYFADPKVGGYFLHINNFIDIDLKDMEAARIKHAKTSITGQIIAEAEEIKAKVAEIESELAGPTNFRAKIEALIKLYELIDQIREYFK